MFKKNKTTPRKRSLRPQFLFNLSKKWKKENVIETNETKLVGNCSCKNNFHVKRNKIVNNYEMDFKNKNEQKEND